MTRPMGANKSVYGAQLLTPIQQLAAETARGQGISTMSPRTAELAKKYPEIFNAASQKYQTHFANTYPGSLEYESVLSGPMKFSNTGVEYPKIDKTASMYALNPITKQISTNPEYKPTTSDKKARMYILDPKTKRYVKNPNYKPPTRKADGGEVQSTVMPDGYRAGGRVKLI